jgi:hypothetical protein
VERFENRKLEIVKKAGIGNGRGMSRGNFCEDEWAEKNLREISPLFETSQR